MSRAKKDSRNLNCNIDSKIMARFERVCEVAGQTKTIAVERAIQAYSDKMELDLGLVHERDTVQEVT